MKNKDNLPIIRRNKASDPDILAASLADVASFRDVTNHGVVANNGTDQTAVLNALPAGYTYIFPSGTYSVRGYNNQGLNGSDVAGFQPKSNTKYIFLSGAKIQVMTNSAPNYAGIYINNITNFEIWNPEVVGDRATHTITSGGTDEFGRGIYIWGASSGKIYNPYCHDTEGDGIDIICSAPSNIRIYGGKSDNARRNGISIESADTVIIEDYICSNTNGTSPQAGIDIEPYSSNNIMNNVVLKNIKTFNNSGGGINVVHPDLCTSGYDIRIYNCEMDGLGFNNIQPNTNGSILVTNPLINGRVGITVADAYPNAKIFNPVINVINPNTGITYGSVYIYTTNTSSNVTVGNIDIVNAEILTSNTSSQLVPLQFWQPSTGTNTKTFQNINMSVVSNSLVGNLNVNYGLVRILNNCNFNFPKNQMDRTSSWFSSNGSGIENKYITNKGATSSINIQISDSSQFIPGNTYTLEVKSAYQINIQSNASNMIYPFGTATCNSSQVGAKITLHYGFLADGVTGAWFVDSQVGTWTGV